MSVAGGLHEITTVIIINETMLDIWSVILVTQDEIAVLGAPEQEET